MEEKKSILIQIRDTVSTYVLWTIVIALGIGCLLAARGTINVLWIFLTWNRWTLRAIDRWSLLLMGIVWLAVIIFAEEYLRLGADKSPLTLYKRFAKIVGWEVGFGGLMLLLQWIGGKIVT